MTGTFFAVSVTTNCTVIPSARRFTLPGVTIPPTRNDRPCGTSFAATWLGVKKNTRFSWNAALAQREQHDFRDHETERHEVGAPNIERIAPHCKEIFRAAPDHADPLA